MTSTHQEGAEPALCSAGQAADLFGRPVHYLRLSLTDACDFRCVYCMPESAVFRPPAELMRDEEILRLARLFAGVGIRKVRLTGGEPTLRERVADLVREIGAIPGIREVTLTTNGSRLRELAGPLASAGLRRVNIRLDTLDPARFARLSRRGRFEDVWAGVLAAEAAGMAVKLNAVLIRGENDGDDVVELARLTLARPWQVRFIEVMPVGRVAPFQLERLVGTEEAARRIEAALGRLDEADDGTARGGARVYRLPGAAGTVGFISSVTRPFCSHCVRARLTADGRLRLCLLHENEADLLTPLRAGASDRELEALIRAAVELKPREHGLREHHIPGNRVMSEIGG